jgi:hypothetical protein
MQLYHVTLIILPIQWATFKRRILKQKGKYMGFSGIVYSQAYQSDMASVK